MRQVVRLPWEQGVRGQAGPGDARAPCPQSSAWYATAATWPTYDAHGPCNQIPLTRPAM